MLYDVIFNHSKVLGTYGDLCDAVTAINRSMAHELVRIESGESSLSGCPLRIVGASQDCTYGVIAMRFGDENSPHKFWHIYRHPERS